MPNVGYGALPLGECATVGICTRVAGFCGSVNVVVCVASRLGSVIPFLGDGHVGSAGH